MSNPPLRSLEGLRVGVICADRSEHPRLVERLAEHGAVGIVRAILGDLAAVAEMCVALVVFADGYDDQAIAMHLDGMERWRDGPTLMVVTERNPAPWRPTLERDRPAVLAPPSEWVAKLAALEAARADPEFTD